MNMKAHLESRHVQLARYRTISYDPEMATFSCYNLSGQYVGFQKYRPDAPKTKRNDEEYGRYYTYVTKGQTPFWGLETFYYREDVLFVTEGIFDSVRVHNLALPCLAVFGNNPKHLRSFFKIINRPIVGIIQGDEAGQLLANSCDSTIMCPSDGSDLGDMSEEGVYTLLEPFLSAYNSNKISQGSKPK